MLNITLNFNFADLIKAAKAEAAPENENEAKKGLTYEQLQDTYEAMKDFEAGTLERAAAQTRQIIEQKDTAAEITALKAEAAKIRAMGELERQAHAKAAKRPKKAKTNAKRRA